MVLDEQVTDLETRSRQEGETVPRVSTEGGECGRRHTSLPVVVPQVLKKRGGLGAVSLGDVS